MSKVNSNIKWLIVGTGDIVRKRVIGAIQSTRGSTLHAICGEHNRSTDIASTFGISYAYDDLDKALSTSDIDAVYIATPVYRHHTEAIKAINAGKHVLIEKPLGLNTADAIRIVDAAGKMGVTAGCAYYRRCFDRFRKLKQAIKDDTLGTVTMVRTTYHAWFNPKHQDPKVWRLDPSKSGGGALSDMGSHMFDLIIAIFGIPKTVYAQTSNRIHRDWRIEDCATVILTLANGADVIAYFGWNSKTWTHEFEVVGTEARVRWSPADNGPVMTTIGRESTESVSSHTDNVHQPLIEDFVEAINNCSDPVCPASEAVKTNIILDAIYESARSGCAIDISDTTLK